MKKLLFSIVVLLSILIWGIATAAENKLSPSPIPDPEYNNEQFELPELPPDPDAMIAVAKPVTCTMKPFEELRKEIMQKYGEVGVVRFLSSVGTQMEILANPVSGTSTLLEYLPQEKITCILGNGGNTEYNTNLFNVPGTKGRQEIKPAPGGIAL